MALVRRMMSAGSPRSRSKRAKASNGEVVSTPPKSQITASIMIVPCLTNACKTANTAAWRGPARRATTWPRHGILARTEPSCKLSRHAMKPGVCPMKAFETIHHGKRGFARRAVAPAAPDARTPRSTIPTPRSTTMPPRRNWAFRAAPIEGPTHFSQFAPLCERLWGEAWFETGCISAHYRNPVFRGRRGAGDFGKTGTGPKAERDPDGEARRHRGAARHRVGG